MKSKLEPVHYKSIVAYDGTEFHGFQRQEATQRTVQRVLESALTKLGWDERSIRAAGRTDSGVHARGQVISFHLSWSDEPDRLTAALNAQLPEDVAIRSTRVAPVDFEPRFSAIRRRYIYSLLVDSEPDPMRERSAWRIWPAPNVDRMQVAAEFFEGTRDFGAFGQPPIPGGHTVRTVSRSEWLSDGRRLSLIVEADAFLYRMVRRIAGATVLVGKGESQTGEIERSLADPAQKWVGKPAPAKGLSLDAVYYEA